MLFERVVKLFQFVDCALRDTGTPDTRYFAILLTGSIINELQCCTLKITLSDHILDLVFRNMCKPYVGKKDSLFRKYDSLVTIPK